MFWCRDIGLAKRLLGYSVWLLGSGLAAANHEAPKSVWMYKPTPHLYTMFWCRDIGLAKRLLGYSVWLLGSGLAASNHDTPKASCQYEWYKPTPTPLWHSEWKIFLCEFWLLRCSTMVARAWPVSVEVIQDWLLAAPSQTSPPSCFYDTSILRYPFDLFQWKSMGRVAKVL